MYSNREKERNTRNTGRGKKDKESRGEKTTGTTSKEERRDCVWILLDVHCRATL